MKLDVKKIKGNFKKLTGAKYHAAVVTPVAVDARTGYCTPTAPSVLKYRLDSAVKYAAVEPVVITPTTQSMSILSLEVRDDTMMMDEDFIKRKKDALHTIRTTKMKRSQASTHINVLNLDNITKTLTAAQTGTGKKVTSLKSLGISLSNLFKPSRIGRNQDMMEAAAGFGAPRNEQPLCRNSSVKSSVQFQPDYVNVRESMSSLQFPPPLPPRPAFMKQSATNQSKQKIQPKAVRPTPYPRGYENSMHNEFSSNRHSTVADYEATPRLNHAQMVSQGQEVVYENQINLDALNALKSCINDRPASVPAQEPCQPKPEAKSVYEVKHGVSIRKKQPSMGVKAATLKCHKTVQEGVIAPVLAQTKTESSEYYDSEVEMLIKQRSALKRQELAYQGSLDQETKHLSTNVWHSEANLNRLQGLSATTFGIIESIKNSKQDAGVMIPHSHSQQSVKSEPNDSNNLVPFLDNTSSKRNHTIILAQKGPFSPARLSLASKQSNDSVQSSDVNNNNQSSSSKTKSVSTSTSSLLKFKSAEPEPIYENDWSLKQRKFQAAAATNKFLSESTDSLQNGKFLPKSTSSTSSASSLRSMDSTASLSGSSSSCHSSDLDMDTIVSSASMNAMGASATLDTVSSPPPRSSSSHRRLFLDNTSSDMNFVDDATMV